MTGTSETKVTLSDETPITWDFVIPLIYVDTPEITTLSPSSNVCVGETCIETCFEVSHTNVVCVSVYSWTSVSILEISFPFTSET